MLQQPGYICSKLTIETLEKCVKSIQKQKINKETRTR